MKRVNSEKNIYYVNTKTRELHRAILLAFDPKDDIWLAKDPAIPDKKLRIKGACFGKTVFFHAEESLQAFRVQTARPKKKVYANKVYKMSAQEMEKARAQHKRIREKQRYKSTRAPSGIPSRMYSRYEKKE